MFEVSMLYTAVTRASQSVYFYSHYSTPYASELLQEMHANELNNLEKLSNIIESKSNEL
jgi:ATP-dependent exoDNAse (exonuclease V) alpha subunit